MSRVGNSAIIIPEGVNCTFENSIFTAKGKSSEQTYKVPSEVKLEMKDGSISFSIANKKNKTLTALWGTTRANVNNAVIGVSQGFTKKLEINGVGYRASVSGSTLKMQLGFSHEVDFPIPQGITITVEKSPAAIVITGANKQQVGQVATEIRKYRPPEPYKGKGLKYDDETIFRKEGKKK